MKSIPRPSKIFEIGDLVRVPFPHVETDRKQARPALVIGRPTGVDSLLTWTLMVTSAQRSAWPDDIAVGPDHDKFGLPLPCFIRVAKIAAIETAAIDRRVGRLPEDLMMRIQAAVAQILAA